MLKLVLVSLIDCDVIVLQYLGGLYADFNYQGFSDVDAIVVFGYLKRHESVCQNPVYDNCNYFKVVVQELLALKIYKLQCFLCTY